MWPVELPGLANYIIGSVHINLALVAAITLDIAMEKAPLLAFTWIASGSTELFFLGCCVAVPAGYTDDVLEYIRISVPKTMLADLKDSVRNDRSLNIKDKYGSSAVSDFILSAIGALSWTLFSRKPDTVKPLGCKRGKWSLH